jgi:exodeoxyribonuclease VII large subunit
MSFDAPFRPSTGPLTPPQRRPGVRQPGDLTVTELNQRVRLLLERQVGLVTVVGELSNITRASSGHWYFTLKDGSAQVRAAMFRSRAQGLRFEPRQGDHVRIRAQVGLYEARGDYQLTVESMQPAGAGDLFAAFQRLKTKLADEGLFAAEHKRALPAFPLAIGVVTSRLGAALQDILTTLMRRAPGIRVVIYPASVQGDSAARELMLALDRANERREVDVVILARGGGAMEDLFAFNDEALARTLFRSLLPVITGIGHETDFTIADFVADHRAATPTAAALAAVPDWIALRAQIRELGDRHQRSARRRLYDASRALDLALLRLLSPRERLARTQATLQRHGDRLKLRTSNQARNRRDALQRLTQRLKLARPAVQRLGIKLPLFDARLHEASRRRLQRATHQVDTTAQALELLAPHRILGRGYALVRTSAGAVVRSSDAAPPGTLLRVDLASGQLHVEVNATSSMPSLPG